MNINKMLQQAQKLQSQMAEMQSKIASMEVQGSSGGGMVKVTVTGDNTVKAVSIDPKIINAEEKEMLEDLIVAALRDGQTKAQELSQSEMSSLTAGMPMPPGMKFPF
jgi:DNA-binding YbaB/EbfC family protein